MSQARFEVRGTWDGQPLAEGEGALVELRVDRAQGVLVLNVDAAFYDDPPPPVPPGSVDGLWEYEVVELFLLGSGERYLEIELGPHGHHLGLRLEGKRRVVESGIPIELQVELSGSHWHGEARIALDQLPDDLCAANAYAIHGEGEGRRYLAAHPVPGPAPDFHRLEYFAPFSFDQA